MTNLRKTIRLNWPALTALLRGLALVTAAPVGAQNSPSPASLRRPILGPPAALARNAPPSPLVRVALSRPQYRIKADPQTGAPQMPNDIVATANALQWPAGLAKPAAFTWRVYLDWNFAPYPTHHAIHNREFAQPSPFRIRLADEVRGGTLTVVAKTQVNGREIWGQAQARILADNPSRQAVLRAFPRSRFGLIASKIGMTESGLRQFTETVGAKGTTKGTEPGGLPVLSRTNDVGMMQLNAPSGAITSPEQVWDWRANVQRGLEMLAGKRRTTRVLASRHAYRQTRDPELAEYQLACLNVARLLCDLPCLTLPDAPALSEQPGSGIAPGDADPDNLRLSQIERDAIRRYNGGHEYVFALTPDPGALSVKSAGWQIDPTRGGIRPTSGDPDYVRRVLSARSGLDITPPPTKIKPAKAKPRRVSPSRHPRHH